MIKSIPIIFGIIIMLLIFSISISALSNYYSMNTSDELTVEIILSYEHELLDPGVTVPTIEYMNYGARVIDGVFRSRKFAEGLSEMCERFDYVIFDGGALLKSSEMLFIARFFDGVSIVIEAGKTTESMVSAARKRIDSVGARLLGVLFNRST